MKLFTWMRNTVQYLFDGVSRLFKATDDDYPKTGVQPFSGDPSDDSKKYSQDFSNPTLQQIYGMSNQHIVSLQKAIGLLKSDSNKGVFSDEVKLRPKYFGKNELKQIEGKSKLSIFGDRFTNVMLVMLIAIAIISARLGLRHGNFAEDSVTIFTVVILNILNGGQRAKSFTKADDSIGSGVGQ